MRPLTLTVLTLGVALGSSLAVSAPAHAASGIEVSSDGVTYSASLPGALFQLTDPLIPGSVIGEDLWVRNAFAAPGELRVSLIDVVTTDPVFADALTVGATLTGGGARPAVALSAANPCAVLLEGPILQPGETRRLHTELALGDLTGTAGQGATASMSIRVALVDPAYPAFAATDCGPDGTELPVIGQPEAPAPNPAPAVPDGARPAATVPPAGSTSTTTGSPLGSSPDSAIDSAFNGATATGTHTTTDADTAAPDEQLPASSMPLQAFVNLYTGDVNLLLIFMLIGGFSAGVAGFWLLAWRRRRRDDEQAATGEAA